MRMAVVHRVAGAGRPLLVTVIVAVAVVFAGGGCSLWFAPPQSQGRSNAPEREILVLHNLAQTVSSVELRSNGALLRVDHDLTTVGAIPGGLVEAGQELVVTLSGENRLILLDRDRLVVSEREIVLPENTNPMQTVPVVPGVFATTGLFTGRVHLTRRDGVALDGPWVGGGALAVGAAPQALVRLPGAPGSTPRIAAAATGFDASRPGDSPFGKSSVVLINVGVSGSLDPVIESAAREAVWEDSEDGRNITALLDVAAVDDSLEEILAIGSGVNMGAGGTGEDDGTVLVLHRDTLAVLQDIPVGGSPGGGLILRRSDGGLSLFLAGVDGITSLQRPPGASEWDADSAISEFDATAGGGLPLLAGIARWNNSLYVADFGNDRILRFVLQEDPGGVGFTAGWHLAPGVPEQSISVSDGPQALSIQIRNAP